MLRGEVLHDDVGEAAVRRDLLEEALERLETARRRADAHHEETLPLVCAPLGFLRVAHLRWRGFRAGHGVYLGPICNRGERRSVEPTLPPPGIPEGRMRSFRAAHARSLVAGPVPILQSRSLEGRRSEPLRPGVAATARTRVRPPVTNA